MSGEFVFFDTALLCSHFVTVKSGWHVREEIVMVDP